MTQATYKRNGPLVPVLESMMVEHRYDVTNSLELTSLGAGGRGWGYTVNALTSSLKPWSVSSDTPAPN